MFCIKACWYVIQCPWTCDGLLFMLFLFSISAFQKGNSVIKKKLTKLQLKSIIQCSSKGQVYKKEDFIWKENVCFHMYVNIHTYNHFKLIEFLEEPFCMYVVIFLFLWTLIISATFSKICRIKTVSQNLYFIGCILFHSSLYHSLFIKRSFLSSIKCKF